MDNEQIFKEQKRAEDIELGKPVPKLDTISLMLPNFARKLKTAHKEGYLTINWLFEICLSWSVEYSEAVKHCESMGYKLKEG